MPMTEDLTIYFNTAEFATSATYTPSGGVAATVNIIFDNPYLLTQAEGAEVGSRNPTALAKKTDFPSETGGGALTISSVNYTITEVHPDETDVLVTLQLRKALI